MRSDVNRHMNKRMLPSWTSLLRPLLPILLTALPLQAMAYESAFSPTETGTAEVKTLPSGILLKSSATGNYFERGNSLFRPLFRYISEHKIAMTVPVEARIDDAAMYFWVAESEVAKVTGSQGEVEVIEIPERTVASLGSKGSYSQSNFEKARARLLNWLDDREDLQVAGEPYAVYWNGPFTLWFMKRFEVHVPVTLRSPATRSAAT